MSETELLYSEMKVANYNFLPFSSKTLQKNALPTLAKLNCKKYAFLLTVAIFGNVSQHDHSRDDNNTTEFLHEVFSIQNGSDLHSSSVAGWLGA